MPVIPKYDGPNVIPQYQPQYTQFQDTTRGMIPPEKFNGEGMVDLAFKLQKQQADAFLANGSAELERYIADTLYGTTDEKGVHTDGVFDLKGANATRADEQGRSLVERTDQAILDKANEIAEQMPEWARQRFLEGYVRNRSSQVYNQVAGHVMQQNAAWAKAGFDNHVNNMVNAVVLSVNDPLAFQENLKGLKDAVLARGQALGSPNEETQKLLQEATSSAYLGSIQSLLQQSETGDMHALVTQATNLYAIAAQNDYLTAEDKLRAQKLVDEYGTTDAIEQLGKKVTNELPQYVAFGGCALTVDQQHKYGINIFTSGILWQESSNQHYDAKGNVKVGAYSNGKRPANPKDWAFGKAQVTEGAAKDAYRYLGWQWSSAEWEKVKNDPRLNEAVGQAYILSLVDHYKGDMDKAVVAYNQGPPRIDKLCREAEKEGVDWKTKLTPTAKNYLDGVKKQYAKRTDGKVYDADGNRVSINDGNYAMLGKPYMTREQCAAVVRQEHPEWESDNPILFNRAVDSMMTKVGKQQQNDQQEQSNAITDVLNTLMRNNWDLNSVTTDQWLSLTNDSRNQIYEQAHKAAIRDDSGNYELYMSYAKDPAKWAYVDESQLPAILQAMPPQYRESAKLKFYEVHQNLIQATQDKAELGRLADQGMYIKDYIVSAGTIMGDLKHLYGDKFKKENEWTNGICDLVQLALADQMQRNGVVYTEDKRRNAIEQFMDQQLVVPGRLWGENTVDLLNLKYKDLPARDDKDIRPVLTAVAKGMNNFRNVRNREPSETEVTNAMRYLFMFKNPPRMADITIPMDGAIKEMVLTDAKRINGEDLSEPDLIRAYILARLEGITSEEAIRRLRGSDYSFSVATDFLEDLMVGSDIGRVTPSVVRPEKFE